MFLALGARIPVISFTDRSTGLQCDLSVGSTAAVLKSTVLGEILKVDPKFVDLVILVKKWAKCNGINNGRDGTINSFALVLLVITYLQHRKLLPPLKNIIPKAQSALSSSSKQDILKAVPELVETAKEWVMIQREQKAEANSPLKDQNGLADIFLDFLVTLGLSLTRSGLGLTFNDRVEVASSWSGLFKSIEYNRKKSDLFYIVEDPFEPKENCARTLQKQAQGVQKVMLAIQHSLLRIDKEIERGAWWKLDNALFGTVEEKEGIVATAPGPIHSLINKIILWELEEMGAVENPVHLHFIWSSAMLLNMICDTLQAQNIIFFTGAKKHLVLCHHTDVMGCLAKAEVSRMMQNARRPLNPLDKLEKIVISEEDFPVELLAAHHSTAVANSIFVLAEEKGFVCKYLENGSLKVEAHRTACNGDKLEHVEDGYSLSRVLLTEIFIHLFSTVIRLPCQEWTELDLTKYLVPAAWVRKIIDRIKDNYLNIRCKRSEEGIILVKLREVPCSVELYPEQFRSRSATACAAPSSMLNNCLCVVSLTKVKTRNEVLRFWNKAIFRPRARAHRAPLKVSRQSLHPLTLNSSFRVTTSM